MSKIKSKDVFEEQRRAFIEKYTGSDADLCAFLAQIYESKLYYDYYIRFMDGHHIATLEQFRKLINDPKVTKNQLRTALELSLADIENLWIQVEDFQQDEDYQDMRKENELDDKLHEINSLKNISIINLFFTLVLIFILIFK